MNHTVSSHGCFQSINYMFRCNTSWLDLCGVRGASYPTMHFTSTSGSGSNVGECVLQAFLDVSTMVQYHQRPLEGGIGNWSSKTDKEEILTYFWSVISCHRSTVLLLTLLFWMCTRSARMRPNFCGQRGTNFVSRLANLRVSTAII